MPGLAAHPLTAIVWPGDLGSAPARDWMRDDLRRLKAALLYADRVGLCMWNFSGAFRVYLANAPDTWVQAQLRQGMFEAIAALARREPSDAGERLPIPSRGLTEAEAKTKLLELGAVIGNEPWEQIAAGALVDEIVGPPPQLSDLADHVPKHVVDVLRDLRAVVAADAFDVPICDRDAWTPDWFVNYANELIHGANVPVPSSVRPAPTTDQARARAGLEGALAVALLGQLEAFPDASIDVILDVRERLTRPRKHFRAAMVQAAKELADAGESVQHLDGLVAELRAQIIDSALEEIREELAVLRVRRTLLRIGSDPRAITGAGAALSVAAGAGGGLATLGALVGGAVSAPAIVAAAAKEIEFREEKKAALHTRPYWILHKADEGLRRG